MENQYNTLRGDGSIGQIDNIGLSTPTDGTTYSGQVVNLSPTITTKVSFMIIFSGLGSSDNTIIFDYIRAEIDPTESNTYDW